MAKTIRQQVYEELGLAGKKRRELTDEQRATVHRIVARRAYQADPEAGRRKQKIYRDKNKDRVNANYREYIRFHPERTKERRRANYLKNRERRLAASKEWASRNREHLRAYAKAYHKKVVESGAWKKWYQGYKRPNTSAYQKKRRADNPGLRILCLLRSRLCEIMVRKKLATSKSLMLNSTEIRDRMERLWKPGMTWENYGKEWECDHIRPCAMFDFSIREEAVKCFSVNNLQPLWKSENRAKLARPPTNEELALIEGLA